jgi:hypothetical protein
VWRAEIAGASAGRPAGARPRRPPPAGRRPLRTTWTVPVPRDRIRSDSATNAGVPRRASPPLGCQVPIRVRAGASERRIARNPPRVCKWLFRRVSGACVGPRDGRRFKPRRPERHPM